MSTRPDRAAELVRLVEDTLGVALPVRVRAWDGSEAGAPAAPGTPVVVLRSRRALRHLLWSPGELGLARAYVLGDLDVEGDLAVGLSRLWSAVRSARQGYGVRLPRTGRVPAGLLLRGARLALRCGALGPRPRRPAAEARLGGRLHTRRRDRAAVAHHYDLSNAFYELLLDSRMTYSCAFYPTDDPSYGLEEAQHAKLELVCRKLDLRPGSRLLDVGCGWGSLSLHAAEQHGARVTAVTLSGEQRHLVRQRAEERGLGDRVDVRVQHVADLAGDPTVRGVDAICSLEMGEHVGDEEYAAFAQVLHDTVRPGGRVLVQQMSRGDRGDRGERGKVAPGGGAFIESYIAPDMHMKPLATTLALLAGSGLEIRDVQAMREHYPRTVRAWADTLEQRWDEAVDLVGEQTARVWRLYLAGGALAFTENRMGVDQVLLVRPTTDGRSHMPCSPLAWLSPDRA